MMVPPELPEWVRFVQALGPSVAAFIAALIAAFFAYRQWRIARDQWLTSREKLILDLFEKRFTIYEELRENLTRVVSEGGGTTSALLVLEIEVLRNQVNFLFGQDVREYVDTIIGDIDQMNHAARKAQRVGPFEAAASMDRESGINMKLLSALQGLDRIMEPYLAMRQKLPS